MPEGIAVNVCDLLKHADVEMPLTRGDGEGDFLRFAKNRLYRFRDRVGELEGCDPVTRAVCAVQDDINQVCEGVIETIKRYLSGYPHAAYVELDKTVTPIRGHLDRLRSPLTNGGKVPYLYRFRLQVSPPLTREEMFHIPFELRHKVATQRYSIPGLPSLYLSGSVYTCWAEMRQPAFSEIQASCFWLSDSRKVNLVDFGYRPRSLAQRLEKGGHTPVSQVHDEIVSYLVCWPLMAMASTKTRYPDAPFKPEYIIPQILLQWISQQEDIDGIRYFSTHVDWIHDDPHWNCNYVFPAKKFSEKGRCSHLRSLFKLTEPASWQLLLASGMEGVRTGGDMLVECQLAPGVTGRYGFSDFGKLEARLNTRADSIRRQIAQPGGKPELGDVLP